MNEMMIENFKNYILGIEPDISEDKLSEILRMYIGAFDDFPFLCKNYESIYLLCNYAYLLDLSDDEERQEKFVTALIELNKLYSDAYSILRPFIEETISVIFMDGMIKSIKCDKE